MVHMIILINCVKLTQGKDGPDQRAPAQPPARHRPGQHGPQHKQGGVVETRNINIELSVQENKATKSKTV